MLPRALAHTYDRTREVSGAIEPALHDAEFVARIRGGDAWAAEALYRRHVDTVLGVVTRLLGSRDDAQDVVQETFVQMLTHLHQLKDPEAVQSWLLTIAVRKVHRRFRRQRLLQTVGLDDSVIDVALDSFVAQETSAEDRAELSRLDDVLRRCPGPQRTAWMLRYVEGHTLPEVAELCGCSLAAAKRRIAAAQGKVRRHVSKGALHG